MKDIIELISNKIERPKEYHNFADKKNILNIPNTVNVVSNISFLIPVFYLLKSTKKRSLKVNLLMIHLVLLGIASTYYHYIPSDKTLFWDMLMIATTSMVVLNIFMTPQNLQKEEEKVDSYQLLFYHFGFLSVIYWKFTGDIRLYLIILIGVPLYIILKNYKNKDIRNYLLLMIVSNIILRLSEHNDHFIYQFTNKNISGHTIKHIFAGIGIFSVIKILEKTNKI